MSYVETFVLIDKCIADYDNKYTIANEKHCAKNEAFQAELDKIILIVKPLLKKAIANCQENRLIAQAARDLKNHTICYPPQGYKEKFALKSKIDSYITRLTVLYNERMECNRLNRILQDRICTLVSSTNPAPLPKGWWNQFEMAFTPSV